MKVKIITLVAAAILVRALAGQTPLPPPNPRGTVPSATATVRDATASSHGRAASDNNPKVPWRPDSSPGAIRVFLGHNAEEVRT